MTISVCMIVRDEAEVLGRLLAQVTKFADQIVIVDTGSIDATKSIARQYTDDIYDYAWDDDFASARNYSLSLARCDYIMWLDADDYITDDNVSKICSLKHTPTPKDLYMCRYATHFDSAGAPTFVFYRERIFRRDKGYTFVGFVHECIVPSGDIAYSDITIEHRKVQTMYSRRNLDIYRRHLRAGAHLDTRAQYYYAKELYYHGYYTRAIRELKKFLRRDDQFYPNTVDAYLTISRCLVARDDYRGAMRMWGRYLSEYTPDSEVCCEIADIFWHMGQANDAIYYYRSSLSIQPDDTSGRFIRTEYYYLVPLLQLTSLCYRIGRYDEAKFYHSECQRLYPQHPTVVYNDQFFSL